MSEENKKPDLSALWEKLRPYATKRNIAIAAAVLLALILLIVLLATAGNRQPEDVLEPTVSPEPEISFTENEGDEEPGPAATESEPVPVDTDVTASGLKIPDPVDLTNAILPKQAEGYLPVFEGVKTEKKQIAITVDDLWQEANVTKILDVCDQTGAKLTFFPIGEAVVENGDLLRRIYESGHEIENHTYNHVNLYSLTTKDMIGQLIKQNLVINKALGVDYRMHFLRPRGGNADYDLRMHKMLQQMGYVGVSHWSLSGTPDMNTWKSQIKPGQVILFHATDKDVAKLVKLIPALVKAGYEVVTLNEIYGLPANETYPLGTTTLCSTELLDMAAMEDIPLISLKSGDASYAVQRLQSRLKELGFYDKDCDGEYGSGTVTAVEAFQTAANLAADGIAGSETQKILFSDSAPRAR